MASPNGKKNNAFSLSYVISCACICYGLGEARAQDQHNTTSAGETFIVCIASGVTGRWATARDRIHPH